MKPTFNISLFIFSSLFLMSCTSTHDENNDARSLEDGKRALVDFIETTDGQNTSIVKYDGDKQAELAAFLFSLKEQSKKNDDYYEKIHKHIKKHWNVESDFGDKNLSVRIEVTISRRDLMSDGKIINSSGNTEFNSSALEALNRVPNLPKFPQGIRGRRNDSCSKLLPETIREMLTNQ